MNKTLIICLMILGTAITACVPHAKNRTETHVNAIERLRAGNDRFVRHRMKHPDQSAARIMETSGGQHPYAVIITCSDSRVAPEIVFDEGIGDLFVIRNAGNIVEEEDVLASVEYAVAHLGVRTVMVMGHERCGAIEAMTREPGEDEPKHILAIIQRLKNEPEEQQALRSGDTGERLVHQCVAANVAHGVAALSHQLHHLKGHGTDAGISIVGAVYDIQTGVVHFQEIKPSHH